MERLIHGDCREVLRSLEPDSIDAIVTDPPYELGFMGKSWDASGVAYNVDLWREALRVLKPGGHLLAFGGSRTYHRLACAVEDAGFEIRDMIEWLYGSGFPKSLDVSKSMDKAAGADREVITEGARSATRPHVADQSQRKAYRLADSATITAPATDLAHQWQGWGTALKPAHEPIVVARKPLVGTVAQNVERYGTGAINVDGCRIPTNGESLAGGTISSHADGWDRPWKHSEEAVRAARERSADAVARAESLGRFPANLCLDEEAAAMLDEQSGERPSGSAHVLRRGNTTGVGMGYGSSAAGNFLNATYGDSGGASRFFYTAKASGEERGPGNTHPTVKPLALMRWLVRLVTPPAGVVLDPFTGSGTTLVAALVEGFGYIGIEREEEYIAIARRRLELAQPPLFGTD